MTKPITQGTPEWHEARRLGVSSTDLAAILGLSPYTSEADVARRKQGVERPEPDAAQARRMRLGLALEDIVAAEDELEHGIKLRRVKRLLYHRTLPWAITSLDFERIGQKCIVEIKTSRAGKWDDGLPLDVECQVRWQMGVARYPAAHVAVLRYGSDLECHDLTHDQEQFDGLVAIAEDFRLRLDAGGPFKENVESVKRAYPRDDGTTISADSEIDGAAHELLDAKDRINDLYRRKDVIETALKQRIGIVARVVGDDFTITWKQSKPSRVVAWGDVARELRSVIVKQLGNTMLVDTIVDLNTSEQEGPRPFRVLRSSRGE